MSNKEENVENDIKEEKDTFTDAVDRRQGISSLDDKKEDEEIRKDEENVPLIKKEKIKKINDEEFNKRVKEIFNAGQDYDSDSEELSDTYSYRSSCSTCRSDSTHYHLQ
jgi:hypothetical protein